jgi:hypothetical protein
MTVNNSSTSLMIEHLMLLAARMKKDKQLSFIRDIPETTRNGQSSILTKLSQFKAKD